MAFLEQFSDKEKELLASLPYRVGAWISAADRDGGSYAEKVELDALEKIIQKKSAGMFESAFVHEVMVETSARRDDWSKWADDIENVADDCEKAIRLLSGKGMSRREQDAYRSNIMFIATEVAKAFGEFSAREALPVRVWSAVKSYIDMVPGLITGRRYEAEALMNISYEEDIVLARLSEALHVGVDDVEETVSIREQ